jgi:hypothetical protein
VPRIGGKPEGEKPLGRPRRRWVDTIKKGLAKLGRGGMGWIDPDQDMNQ